MAKFLRHKAKHDKEGKIEKINDNGRQNHLVEENYDNHDVGGGKFSKFLSTISSPFHSPIIVSRYHDNHDHSIQRSSSSSEIYIYESAQRERSKSTTIDENDPKYKTLIIKRGYKVDEKLDEVKEIHSESLSSERYNEVILKKMPSSSMFVHSVSAPNAPTYHHSMLKSPAKSPIKSPFKSPIKAHTKSPMKMSTKSPINDLIDDIMSDIEGDIPGVGKLIGKSIFEGFDDSEFDI